jgi:hypothetical protein
VEEPHRPPPPLPQTPLSYQSAGSAPGVHTSHWSVLARFFAGLILGAVVSAIIWFAGWNLLDKGNGSILLIVPGAKLVVGIVFICIRGWRSFGAGILVSIALGVLIFFGACAMNVDWNKMH